MMCGHCEARVKKALEAVDGVDEVRRGRTTTAGTAVVTLSKDVAADDAQVRRSRRRIIL